MVNLLKFKPKAEYEEGRNPASAAGVPYLRGLAGLTAQAGNIHRLKIQEQDY